MSKNQMVKTGSTLWNWNEGGNEEEIHQNSVWPWNWKNSKAIRSAKTGFVHITFPRWFDPIKMCIRIQPVQYTIQEPLYREISIQSQEYVEFLKKTLIYTWDTLLELNPPENARKLAIFSEAQRRGREGSLLQPGQWNQLLSVVERVLTEGNGRFTNGKNYHAALNLLFDFIELQKHIFTQITALKEGKEKSAKIQNKLECAFCRKLDSRLKICGQCRQVAYCGQEHQKAHWPVHKTNCKKKIQKNT